MEDIFSNIRRLFFVLLTIIIILLVLVGLLLSCSPTKEKISSEQRLENLFKEADKEFDKKYGIKEYHKSFNINNKKQ